MQTRNGFLNTLEAASELHISRSTLTRWVQAGKVKPVVRGDGRNGAMFFRASEIKRVRESIGTERKAS